MLRNRALPLLLAICSITFYGSLARAQTSNAVVEEDFTGGSTTNSWYYYNGACLTASTAPATANPGSPPGCTKDSYYGSEPLVGGYNGAKGGSQTLPDPSPTTTTTNGVATTTSYGALRFTNGCVDTNNNGSCGSGGHSQNGAIISQDAFSTSQGLDITFKTVSYRGDSGGNGAGCPSGTSLSNGNCTGTETTGATPSAYKCPSGYGASGTIIATTICSKVVTASPTKSSGQYYCPGGYTPTGTVSSTTTCSKTVTASSQVATYTCPTGWTLSSSSCSQSVNIPDPHGNDGADGMSFFLMNGGVDMTNNAIDHIGSWGGSLGYSCSNRNADYHGMVGGYLGLGIDEYGNFLNGTQNTLGIINPQSLGDNTASGGGQWANRIGLRGQGSIDWYWLSTNYATDYPSSLTTAQQQAAVQNTCKTGTVWDYSTPSSPSNTGTAVNDYAAIPNAFTVISSTIANEYSSGGYSRRPANATVARGDTGATPITYRLKLTEDGLLSLDYSFDGGAWTHVITNQNIAASNGTVPSTVRFGFGGSTGGASNIHEILCFKATPATQAASSTTVNQQQSSKVESGSQAYFGYYDPTDWTGRLTANPLITDASGNLTIGSAAWDASCVLTGVASTSKCGNTGQAGPVSAQLWSSRVMLTWSDSAGTGIPLEWSNLSPTEQADLTAGDSSQTENRLDYLRGARGNEIPTTGPSGTQIYRDRDSVLGDIVDSSSTWVGPPSKMAFSAYESPATWHDKLYPTATMPENSSNSSYDAFAQAQEQRQNVVYVGANDGLVHGFSAGSYDSTGTTYNSSTNTGSEVLAYMPQGVLESIHSATNAQVDYSNAQYGHNFFVDATPGTGDLYYNSAWHTWLVGGLGSGGAEIYALDVTNPANFSEANASSLVIGDWTQSSITCTNPATSATSSCANSSGQSYLGNTYGTPQIRRLHNGDWAVIFGNGLNSPSGDAGIFILTISSSGTQTLYYLSTGVAGGNGIAYVSPVDMDGDHVVDYVYAGDVKGNLWRFDLTNSSPSNWAVTPGPIFKTQSGTPITTAVQPDFVTGPIGSSTQLLLFFGTGQKFPLTNTSPVSYQTGTQSFYGVWDWNMSAWNAHASTQFASLSSSTAGTASGLGSPYTLTTSNLTQQTVSTDSSTGDRFVSSTSPVCWTGTSTCTGGSSANKSFGWYLSLPGTNTAYSTTTYEQLVYNPMIVSTAVVFNSILPAVDSPLMCTPDKDYGWTYALDVRTGGPVPSFFDSPGTSSTNSNLNTQTIGYEGDASGSSSEVDTTNGSGGTNSYLIFQSTSGGPGTPIKIHPGANISGSRETWIQLR